MVERHPCVSETCLITWQRLSATPSLLQSHDKDPRRPSTIQGDWSWCTGFLANRSKLVERANTSQEVSGHHLLLDLYHQMGSETARHIRGPFAWILWDDEKRRLVAARDRVGTCGLYYATRGDTVWLSNRVELLVDVLPKPLVFNPRSLALHINAAAPLPGDTFYEGIQAVQPGCTLVITSNQSEMHRYWQISAQPLLKLSSDTEYAAAYRDLLFKVVAEYLPACRTGVMLSGGLDSTSVAAAARAVAPTLDLTAFSWITPELPESDESQYFSAVSEHLGIPLETSRADLHWPMRRPEGIKTSAATPFSNCYTELWDATFEGIRRHDVSILLSGLSGDHLFGANVFVYPDLLVKGRWIELARQICARLRNPTMNHNPLQIMRRMILGPLARAYLPSWRRRPKPRARWMRKPYRDLYVSSLEPSTHAPHLSPGRLQRLNVLRDRLLPQVIEQVNSQAAAYGIDFRHPLLDHRLFEFAASLPTDQTYRATQRKIIVRNGMRGHLPDKVLDKKGKIVITALGNRGLRERESSKIWDLMTDMRAAELGLVDERCLQQAYQDFLDGKQEDALFWYTITLEDWLRRHC